MEERIESSLIHFPSQRAVLPRGQLVSGSCQTKHGEVDLPRSTERQPALKGQLTEPKKIFFRKPLQGAMVSMLIKNPWNPRNLELVRIDLILFSYKSHFWKWLTEAETSMAKSRAGEMLSAYHLDRLENERSGFCEGRLMTLSQDEIERSITRAQKS